jgi:hypothetical protein
MRKLTVRTFFVALIVAASIGSYLYLHTLPGGQTGFSVGEPDQTISYEDGSVEESEIILPDVTLLKRVFEVGRRFLP